MCETELLPSNSSKCTSLSSCGPSLAHHPKFAPWINLGKRKLDLSFWHDMDVSLRSFTVAIRSRGIYPTIESPSKLTSYTEVQSSEPPSTTDT